MAHDAAQTLALALGFGSAVTLACRRFGIPSILPLLITGVVLGRSGVGLVDGAVLGEALGGLITVCICLLIFEGSLHLDRQTLARAPRAVWGLLTVGTLVTWAGIALLARYILRFDWDSSLMLGSVLIVTGPTVIQPILRRLKVLPNVDAVLKAEGILIDPIGAVAAIATLEIIVAAHAQHTVTGLALVWLYAGPFVYGTGIGLAVGFAAARLLATIDREHTESEQLQNLLAMAACLIAVGFSEWLAPESGLIAATLCGIVLANVRLVDARSLHHFKEQVSVLLVGGLFILLASRFALSQLGDLDFRAVLVVAGVVLLVRPISVGCSTVGSRLTIRERAFCAMIAPRGIVAASVASIVALRFSQTGSERLAANGQLIETIVFLVIAVTVACAGLGAGALAGALRVRLGHPNGVILIGAHRLGRELAGQLRSLDIPVALVDTNGMQIATAASQGLPALLGDATEHRWMDEDVLAPETGWLFTATGNEDVDRVVTRWGVDRLGSDHAYRWMHGTSGADVGRCALSDGRPLRKLLADLDTEKLGVETWTGPRDDSIPLAIINDGVLRVVGPDEVAGPDETVVGLVALGEHKLQPPPAPEPI